MKSLRRPKPTPQRDPNSPPPLAANAPRLRAGALCAAALALGLLATPARAEEAVGAQAARLVRELEGQASERALVGPGLSRARHALERAANARRAGDHRHGSELEALALELAQGAAELLREKQAQARVSETEQKALTAETRVIRARALVEQTAARRGRAAERLRDLEAEKTKPAPGAPASAKAAPVKSPPVKSPPEPKKAAPTKATPSPRAP